MFVPSISPAQGHMQVCVVVKAQTRLWQARSLRMNIRRLGELAKANEHARAPVFGHLGCAAASLSARCGRPGQLTSNGQRKPNTPQWCDRPGRYSSTYSAMQPAFAEMRACALACPDSLCGRRGLCALLTEPRVPYECWAYCAGRNCPVKRASVLSRSLSASPGAVAGVCFHHAARADQRRPTSTIP